MNTKIVKVSVTLIAAVALSGCVAKNLANSEQQLRMQQCEKFIDRKKDECLQGDFVSIKDYETEYKAFKKAEKEKLLLKEKDAVNPLKVKLDPRIQVIEPAPPEQ